MARILPPNWWGAGSGSPVFIVVALLLFSFSALHPSAMQKVRTGAADLFAPVLSAVNAPAYRAAAYVSAITGLADLQAENARLRDENAKLRDWYQTALSLETENSRLRALLNVKLEPGSNFITARVIADSGNAFARSLLVLAGAQDGVENGQAVLSGDGLIGRVVETGRTTARILLLTDINSRIPVLIQGSNQRAVMAGNNDGLPVLLHLPQGIEIEEGARVITSGHGGLFPYGLPVGEIVRAADGGLAVRPYAAIDQAHMVRVIDRAADPNLRLSRDGALQ